MSAQYNTDTYALRGVSSVKEAVSNAAKSVGEDKGLFPGAFCKILPYSPLNWFEAIINYFSPSVKIPHSDGAGTKSSLAYIYWRETGDASVFKGIVQDSIVMNLDDILCVGGILGNSYLMSSIDRNSFRIPDEILPILFQADYDFRKKMAGYGIKIYGGVGETADVADTVRTLVINNSMLTRMKKKHVIDNSNISEGDYIVGLSSSGQAIYEDEYNGGMGSNGLTNARHDVLHSEYRTKYPESFEPELLEKNLVYNGTRRLTDVVCQNGFIEPNGKDKLLGRQPEFSTTIGKLILSPTRTYAPIMMEVFRQIGTKRINGIVHCSGGGQRKILKSLPYGLIADKHSPCEIPYLFRLIQNESNLSWEKMYQTFNMGWRLEICVPRFTDAYKIIDIANDFNVGASVVGEIRKSKNPNEKSVKIANCLSENRCITYSETRQR